MSAMLTLALPLLFTATTSNVSAQRRTTQNFPARGDMRLEIRNRMGRITIEAWDRQSIQVVIDRDNPPAQFTPEMNGNTLTINVRAGQPSNAGDVNFQIRVPVGTSVDVETMRGDITVRGVRSDLVRAEVTTEGDVQLTGIRAATVIAKNVMGLIVFEGELMPRGTYRFMSTLGQMHLRIPSDSSFNLMALTRNLDPGNFARSFSQRGHRFEGRVGDGAASVYITNNNGSISFMR